MSPSSEAMVAAVALAMEHLAGDALELLRCRTRTARSCWVVVVAVAMAAVVLQREHGMGTSLA